VRNILVDLTILLDYYEDERRARYPESVKAFDYLKYKDFAFVSASTINNFEFLKYSYISRAYPGKSRRQKLKIVHNFIAEILSYFKVAKVPSYITMDLDDVGGSLVLASARAIDGLVLTRDKKLLEKHPEATIHPRDFLKHIENEQKSRITMLDLTRETFSIYPKIEANIDRVINKSNFILGEEVTQLEEKIAGYIGTKYAIGVSSGTDALVLSLRALAIQRKNEEYWDREDLVITTPFTFTATGDAILRAGATPFFVDIDPDTYNIDPNLVREAVRKYGQRVKGIVPVHLYGQPCNMDEIMEIARENGLFVIEDCAQSFGAKWNEKSTGSFGDTGCFSFFPSKNLGGFGDGGMVTTNDKELAELIRMLLKHGGKDKYNVDHIGYNARLDTLQAAILLAKMEHVGEFTKRRRKIAEIYNNNLQTINWVKIPAVQNRAYHVYHQYTIRVLEGKRGSLRRALKEKGIDTMVYYPVPLHKMRVFEGRCLVYSALEESERASQEVLSLPIEPLMDEEDILRVTKAISSVLTPVNIRVEGR